ncbi:MAG TPA: gamma-glutamyltransferase, partial [Chloroflexi bacterium]|nr:gamma-glutamyltransferase [Chloroflexota bacterium]
MGSSKRSVVMARRGMVSTSQALAAQAGLQILGWGGSAADAAVAVAAVLNVVEPMSTGIGGDMFALTCNAKTGDLRALNGSGRSAGGATLETARQMGLDAIPQAYHGLAVSVPGAVDGWLTLLDEYGRLPLKDVFAPAIYYAEAGFPVSPVIALMWQRAEEKLRQDPVAAAAFLRNGQAPQAGQLFKQSALAEIFHLIIRKGRQAIYEGTIAEGIARTVQAYQGLLTTDDLAAHRSDWDEPIDITYRDHRLVECPPNGQGIIALQVLGVLEPFTFSARSFGQADVLHYQIEAVKLA